MIRCPRCGERGHVLSGKFMATGQVYRRLRRCKNNHAFYTHEEFRSFTGTTLNQIELDDMLTQSAVGGSNGETEVRPDSL